MNVLGWVIVSYVAGVAFSILWPFLLAWIQEKQPFDVRMNVGRLLVALVAVLPLLAQPEFLATLGAMSYIAAFVYGMGASQGGRYLQKTTAAAFR